MEAWSEDDEWSALECTKAIVSAPETKTKTEDGVINLTSDGGQPTSGHGESEGKSGVEVVSDGDSGEYVGSDSDSDGEGDGDCMGDNDSDCDGDGDDDGMTDDDFEAVFADIVARRGVAE